ncbi:anaerobic ribonucleoside-triphosphate reductase [bacterium]|nr:anaerobic ribonucleoside-triphosphate reductase [bacterium]
MIEEKKEVTDVSLFVRTSGEQLERWNRQRIVDALVREAHMEVAIAQRIAKEVEEEIFASHIQVITTSLVRELVDAKLIEYGFENARRMHTRIGVPVYDVKNIIFYPNKENANIPHNPEATNLTLAEAIKREFALLHVFSQEISDAHISGIIHLHDLGFIDRPYCSGQSLEYVKKFGLDLPNALSIAKPARHPEVLLGQLIKFSAALQGHFAGAIGWDAVNLFFAPYLEGLSDREIHQLAQMLIFEFSQQAVARGGQAIFSDINLYWEVPEHFADVPAIGPGGEYTGKTYKEYEKEAQRFVKAIFEVYLEGDGTGRPFFFPKPLVHMTEKFFQTEGWQDFLNFICEVAAEKGNTYFVFDRGGTAKISECCRLSFKLEESDMADAAQPWKMRYAAIQNVTINLPRIAYEAEGSDALLFHLLRERVELAVKAHLQKRRFLEELLSLGSEGPLALLAMSRDGQPYLRMHRATYLIGMVGLNEMVQAHLGKEMHECNEALKFGLKVIAFMKLLCEEFSRKYNMRFVLEQTPAESAAHRLAKLDLSHYPDKAEHIVKGDISKGEIYYTNSTYLNVSVPINPIERVKKEGLFHPLIEAGALTHIWLGEARPNAESLANFVVKVFRQTENAQIAFSPEFTFCNRCSSLSRGILNACPRCSSQDVEGITRVTGYFSRVSGWNKGKRGELKDRFRSGKYFLEEKIK